MHLNSSNHFSDDLLIWAVFKRIAILNLRQMNIRRYASKSINLFLQVCRSLTWATWIGHPTSDPPWSLKPHGWLVSNLRKAIGTICPSDILFTISWQNSQTFSSHCTEPRFAFGQFLWKLKLLLLQKLVSVSVDGRCKYLTPRRQHMFAWRGWISSSRFMFTNYRDSRIKIACRCKCMSKLK